MKNSKVTKQDFLTTMNYCTGTELTAIQLDQAWDIYQEQYQGKRILSMLEVSDIWELVKTSSLVIELANDLMAEFRINATKVSDYGTYYMYSSRLGILKTAIQFDVAIKIIKESLELLKREYDITFENLGMYYTIKKYNNVGV